MHFEDAMVFQNIQYHQLLKESIDDAEDPQEIGANS